MIGHALLRAIEFGTLRAPLVLGMLVALRLAGFPDFTPAATFTTGAAITALLLNAGFPVLSAMAAAIAGGALAGLVTALLHVKGRLAPLLSGLVMMMCLYTLNYALMGNGGTSLHDPERVLWGVGDTGRVATILAIVGIFTVGLGLLLRTHLGFLLRALGENPRLVPRLGASRTALLVLVMAIVNGFGALGGSLLVQRSITAQVRMGWFSLIYALAALELGETLVGPVTMPRLLAAPWVGSVALAALHEVAWAANLPPQAFHALTGILLALILVTRPRQHRDKVLGFLPIFRPPGARVVVGANPFGGGEDS